MACVVRSDHIIDAAENVERKYEDITDCREHIAYLGY